MRLLADDVECGHDCRSSPGSPRSPRSCRCGCADGGTNAAPPLVVCGTTLSAAAAGAVLTDATTDGTVTAVTVGGTVDLLLTQGCDTGASCTVEHGTAHEGVRARTADGAPAAVTLEPTSSSFDVVVRHADGTSSTARVRLAG